MNLRLAGTLSLLAVSGCESEEQVAAEMELALQDANEVLVEALLSAEILGQPLEPAGTLRHGSACGCPCLEQIGVALPTITQLDYDLAACVPTSGLLPTLLAGHAVVEFDGAEADVTWDSLLVGLDQPVTGSLFGGVELGDPAVLSPQGELAVGERQSALDLRLTLEGDGLRLSGQVTVAAEEPRVLELRDLVLSGQDLAGACPRPSAGTAALLHPKRERKDSVVRFLPDGQVLVERDGRESQPTDWCAYASARW
jgi:hypothetical protein